MPGCIVSATTASFRSVEKRRLRATPVITSTLENVSDIGLCLGLSLGPPASAGVRSKRGALHIPSGVCRVAHRGLHQFRHRALSRCDDSHYPKSSGCACWMILLRSNGSFDEPAGYA